MKEITVDVKPVEVVEVPHFINTGGAKIVKLTYNLVIDEITNRFERKPSRLKISIPEKYQKRLAFMRWRNSVDMRFEEFQITLLESSYDMQNQIDLFECYVFMNEVEDQISTIRFAVENLKRDYHAQVSPKYDVTKADFNSSDDEIIIDDGAYLQSTNGVFVRKDDGIYLANSVITDPDWLTIDGMSIEHIASNYVGYDVSFKNAKVEYGRDLENDKTYFVILKDPESNNENVQVVVHFYGDDGYSEENIVYTKDLGFKVYSNDKPSNFSQYRDLSFATYGHPPE